MQTGLGLKERIGRELNRVGMEQGGDGAKDGDMRPQRAVGMVVPMHAKSFPKPVKNNTILLVQVQTDALRLLGKTEEVLEKGNISNSGPADTLFPFRVSICLPGPTQICYSSFIGCRFESACSTARDLPLVKEQVLLRLEVTSGTAWPLQDTACTLVKWLY